MQATNRRQKPPLFGPSNLLRLLTINRETTSPLTTSTASGMTSEQQTSYFRLTTHLPGAPAMARIPA
ncbi:hypothetical protein AB4Z46_14360 [Variovorax sp. M-6]|uniref:hypothetical protein n=1 Tax=Variovorax sp. M-6 TaxID=3233041 RepID=UPI003F954614